MTSIGNVISLLDLSSREYTLTVRIRVLWNLYIRAQDSLKNCRVISIQGKEVIPWVHSLTLNCIKGLALGQLSSEYAR